MNWLDAVILVLVAIYAFTGWIRGFFVTVAEFVGLAAGTALGIVSATTVVGDVLPAGPMWAIGYVTAAAVVGHMLAKLLARGLQFERPALRAVNGVAGTVLSAGGFLVAFWALGYALTQVEVPQISDAARQSAILRTVDRAMPAQANAALHRYSREFTDEIVPNYLQPFEDEVIASTEPPDDAVATARGVTAAAASVARIEGISTCENVRTGQAGSGFVFAPERVMTNAHVVAGVDKPTVTIEGRRHTGRVVLFDDQLDIAVLAVPGLDRRPLAFDRRGKAGDSAAVLGFPEDKPYTVSPARIRNVVKLKGSDIRGRGEILRETFAVRAAIRQGNSGGPLVSTEGKVFGVVFAQSLSQADTGYVLTASQVTDAAARGTTATEAVATGSC